MKERKQQVSKETEKQSFLGLLKYVAKQVKDVRILKGAGQRRKAVREHSRIVRAYEQSRGKRYAPGFDGRKTQWLGLHGKVARREDENGHKVVNTKPRGSSKYGWKRDQEISHREKSVAGQR